MKKHLLSLLYFLFLFNFSFAQEIEWQNTIGGSENDVLVSARQTSDGGYILAGWSLSYTSGDKTEDSNGAYDYWVIKTDSSGNIIWQNTIGSNAWDVLSAMDITTDGGCILAGRSQSLGSGDKTENNHDTTGVTFDYWIVKVDSTGLIEWDNTIGGNQDDYPYSVRQTSDGGFIIGGYSYSNITGDKTENCIGYADYWIVKTDSVGNLQWQNTIGGTQVELINSVAQTTDGGYILGGWSKSSVSGDKTENSNGLEDYWLVKTDSLGNIVWQNTIGGSNDDRLYSVEQTSDGGYILGGYSKSDISGDKTENNRDTSLTTSDYWVIKTDTSGNIEWQKTIGGNGEDQLLSIKQNQNGGYILGGSSSSNISGEKTENRNGADCWFIETDSIGRIVRQNTIGGSSWDYLYSIQQTTEGAYILGGSSDSPSSGDKTENCNGFSDYWIIKLTDNYNLITGKTYLDFNSNQTQDISEPSISANKITEQNTNRFAFSQTNGSYSVGVLDSGNYIVLPTAINYYNAVPVSHSAYFNGIQQTDSLNDFAFQPAGVFNDLCVTITPLGNFRAGMNANYMINYGNYGTTTLSPTVIFFPYFNVSYISASVTPTSVAPDSVVWALPALAPFQTGSIVVTVNVNTGLPIGTLINSSVRIEPIANDANPTCNNHSWEVYTTGAVDPNDIIVSEDTLLTTQLPTAPWLDYIIRFQNTGNDTAFTAKILNPIDTFKLDLNSFEFINASHPVNLNWINYQRNMEFKFENILLPDSNINEPMSHGFVHYRIKPKTTLLAGDSITNFAAIYFDFNSPVITNTAITRIVLPTGFARLATGNGQLAVYPNPANDELTVGNIQLAKNNSVKVFDLYGRIVFEKPVSSANCTLEIANWPSGIYFVQAGRHHARFVKQ